MNIEHSSRIWLPRTGQVTSYADGDDGWFQAGSPRATRFVDNGNGTVSDRATGLTWVKQPELIIPGAVGVHAGNQVQAARGDWANNVAYAAADLAKDTADSTYWVCAVAHTSAAAGTFAADRAVHPTYWRQTVWTASAADLVHPAQMTWLAGVPCCLGARWNPSTGLSYAGHDDWRMPNFHELTSLAYWDTPAGQPGIHPIFVNTPAEGTYWTSTPYKDLAIYKVYCIFSIEGLYVLYEWQGTARYVRPVRGGRLNANW